MSLVLTFGQQPLGFRSQSNRLGHAGAPEVKSSLRIFGEPHQPKFLTLIVDYDLLPVDRHDRNVTPRPVAFFQDFHRGQLAPLDYFFVARSLVDDLDSGQQQNFCAWQLVLKYLRPVRQQDKRCLFALSPEVFSDPNVFFSHPLACIVTSSFGLESLPIVLAGIHLPELRFRNHRGDDCPFSIRSIWRRTVRVEIDRERVFYRLNQYLLIKRILAHVFSHHAPIAPAHPDRVIEGVVIGVVCVAV